MRTTPETSLRLLIAARLSSKPGKNVRNPKYAAPEQGLGIETQDKRSQEWARDQGHTIVDIAADTKSGKTAPWDRKNLKPWVTRPELMTTYDGILAFKNDRLSRGAWADEVRIRLWAEENGKRLIIVNGPWWPPRHEGDKWHWESMADRAYKEWVEIRERNLRIQGELYERGALHGKPPFGYTSDGPEYGRFLVPTPEGRRLIPVIFAAIAAGKTVRAVARLLEQETGRQWWDQSVLKIIRNPVYRGQRTSASGRVLHRCEALVRSEVWRAANESLGSRTPRGPSAAAPALLSGTLLCIRCEDSPMYRICAWGGTFYRCSGRGKKRRGCGNMIPLEDADALAGEVMASLNRPVVTWHLVRGDNHDAEIADVDTELRQLPAQGLSEDAEDAERARLRAQRRHLAALPATPDRWVPQAGAETYAALWTGMDTGQRRSWLRQNAPRIYAGKAGMETRLFGDEETEVTSAAEHAVWHTGRGLVLSVVFRLPSGHLLCRNLTEGVRS